MNRSKVAPLVQTELRALVAAASDQSTRAASFDRLIELTSRLPAQTIFEIENEVGHMRYELNDGQLAGGVRRGLLSRFRPIPRVSVPPEAAAILMISKNGHVREAALTGMMMLPDSPFYVAALIWRLNDWAEPVRRAAGLCAERVLPNVSARAVAGAAPFLLERMHTWGRWQSPPDILVQTLKRVDCVAELVSTFGQSAVASATALRMAMRLALLDNHALELFHQSKRPEFRAMLLKAMIDGEVTWVNHYERQWVNKVYGISRRVPVLKRRPLQRALPVAALIRQGAADKSALVRTVAASGLVNHAASLPEANELMALFASDRSNSVRWRMEYLSRQE